MRVALALLLLVGLADARPGSIVRIEHRDPSALPSRGPRTAPVTLELFFTPSAGGSPRLRQAIDLQAAHPGRVRLVYRIITGGGQALLPNAVLEAQAQGKFDELMTELNVYSGRSGGLGRAALVELGKKAGLDPDRLQAAINENRYDRVLAANARRLKRRAPRNAAAPVMLFNGRSPHAQLGDARGFETEYQDALARAEDLVDRGADPRALARAFDVEAEDDAVADVQIKTGPADEELDAVPAVPMLAQPPLDTTGLPSAGAATAALTIVVACKPTSSNCMSPLKAARAVEDTYPDQVRVVWAPFFDVSSDDAADLVLLGDAALCAERVGIQTALDADALASSGYQWVEQMLSEWQRRRGRHVAASELIDKLGERLRVDARELAGCRARTAGATVAWIERARHAGVKTSPATIVGGRIYGPINDPAALQSLVAAELAGGDLDRLQRDIGLDAWRR